MRDKHFRVPDPLAKDLEVLCKLLGISERQAGEQAVSDWVRKNRNQVSLETWTEVRSSAAPVNQTLITINLALVKGELRQLLQIPLANIEPSFRLEFLRKFQRLIPAAQTLAEETQDGELRELIAEIPKRVGELPRRDRS